MKKKMLKGALLLLGCAAVLLFSGSGYASAEKESTSRHSLTAALEDVCSELSAQDAADWRDSVRQSPAYLFLLAVD